MTRVIHTGDTHLGYQQYHSPARREDFLDAFEQVIDDAVAEDVDAVVHAGDLFHDRRPELPDLLGTIRVLRRLDDADIPFLAVVGNHESTRGGQWLDLFENLGLGERLGAEPRLVGETAFYGLDHVPKSRRDDLEYEFEPHDADYAALVTHGLFTPFAYADWETETVLERSNVDFDAVLLGDNHAPGIETVADTWVTYCGSTERTSAAEKEARGYNLVTFGASDGAADDADDADDANDANDADDANDANDADDANDANDADERGRAVDIRRRTLDTRPFVFVSVELAASEGSDRVHKKLREHDVEDAVVVVEILGEGEPVTPASIEESLAERGALIARVTDRREQDVDSSLDVSFADPDDAVKERVRDLGLSSAALDVDETIRASKTADSNVRDVVENRVSELLDEDTDAFEPAPDSDSSVDAADAEGDGNVADAEGDGDGAEDGGDGDNDADTPAEADASGPQSAAVSDSKSTDGTDEQSTDGQVTMEDF